MKPELKEYQKTAIDKLLEITRILLDKEGSRVCVLKAPTGSGKTLIIANYLLNLAQENTTKKLSFIWISAHNLHKQSRDKIEKYLESSVYKFSYLEEIQDNEIKENEILFVNWEELTKKDSKTGEFSNIYMRDNESERNLPTFVRNTREEGRVIVLIIDESHYYYWGKNSQELAETIIQPKLTIEVSATPKIQVSVSDAINYDAGWVEVKFEDVIAEGMIKKETFINEEFSNLVVDDRSSDEVVIETALKKRGEITKAYQKEKVAINPLILIQLPSQQQATSVLDKHKLERVQEILREKNHISIANGKLAIWLSEEKENLAGIEEADNKVEVLIFKQAIALGWDCPRAQILVMFKEIKSVIFEIQTVGRIMRMPEAKHYDNEILNRAYIFTNLSQIKINQETIDRKYLYKNIAHRKPEYKNLDIPSIYLQRVDYGDLTLSFRKLFLEEANKYFNIKEGDIFNMAYKKVATKLNLRESTLQDPVISDKVIEDIDKVEVIIGKVIDLPTPEDDIKEKFNYLAKAFSHPYAPVRSFTKVQQSIYDWFDKYLGYRNKSRLVIQKIVLCSEENQEVLKEIVERAKFRFKAVREQEIRAKSRIKEFKKWNVPSTLYYNELYEEEDSKKYILKPCYLNESRREPERLFEDKIGKNANVLWWFKNGEKKEDYFGILYENSEKGNLATFYPDYIIKFKDGSIGIYDTKAGFTASASETKDKAEALNKYTSKLNKKGIKVKGGIVIKDSRGWFVNDSHNYKYDTKLSGWSELNL
jgi:type III restriction enzyme